MKMTAFATFSRVSRLIPVAVCALLLAACVTTETGGVGGKKDPDKTLEYSLQLARSYINDGNWDGAKRHLQNAIAIDDDSPEIYEAMALVFQNTGEIELAEENFRKSIRLDPNVSRVRLNYAGFLYSMQRYRDAADQLEVVAEDTLYRQRSIALANLGRCYNKLEEWQKAEGAFRRAWLLDRDNLVLIFEMANVHYRLGEYALSQKYYDSYRSKVTQQAPPALLLGIRLADKFENQNAKSSYILALRNLYPTSQAYLEYKREFGDEN